MGAVVSSAALLLLATRFAATAGEFCQFGTALAASGAAAQREFVDAARVDVGGAFTLEAWIWAAEPEAPTWHTVVSRAARFWRRATDVPNPFADFNLQVDDRARLSEQLAELETAYQFLVVDSAAGISSQTMAFASSADRLLLVVTPDVTSMTDAYGFLKVHNQVRPAGEVLFVVNRAVDEEQAYRAAVSCSRL